MATPLQKRIFWVAAGIVVVVEAVTVYRQWPSPPLKVCASAELGELLASVARNEAELRDARSRLRMGLDDGVTKEVMRLEVASAAASNDVANYKQKALDLQERKKASGTAASGASCS